MLSPEILIGLAIALGILLGIGITFGWRWYRQRRERLQRLARITAVSVDYLQDVSIADGSGGLLHLDYLLLTARGLLILDVRDVVGNVFGSDPMVEWTVMQESRRYTFANPQGGLYDRIAAVTALVQDVPVEARVMFGRGTKFPKGMPRLTLHEESLAAEFPLGDRAQAEQLVAIWRPAWDALRTALAPSEFSARN